MLRHVQPAEVRGLTQVISTVMKGARKVGDDASETHRRLTPTERIRLQSAQEGHAEGFAKGYEEGLSLGRAEAERQVAETIGAQGLAEIQRFAEELSGVSDQVMAAITEWFAAAEESLALLSVLIAERIVRSELHVSPDAILNITREALLEVTHSATARIRINPFESETLREHKDQLMAVAPSLRNIEFVEDSSIQGGCVIETDGGMVDATIAAKLASIIEASRRAA